MDLHAFLDGTLQMHRLRAQDPRQGGVTIQLAKLLDLDLIP